MENLNVLGDNIGFVKLVASMGDDLTIVNSARVSYNRQSEEFLEKDTKLIKYLLANNHSSPLEHVMFTFNVKVPFFIERQWQRHRSWKYFSLNEISRRYSSENIQFYIPKSLRFQSSDNKQMSSGETLDEKEAILLREEMLTLCQNSLSLYNRLLQKGVARELARGTLPVFQYTNFYATCDLHNLLWFLELRRHPHAQEEIRKYALAIEEIIKEIVPTTYRIWETVMTEKYKRL